MKKTIKKLLNNMPFLFNLLVNIYYYSEYIFYRFIVEGRFRNIYLNEKVSLIKLPTKNISFFGYYNISPFNNRSIVWCETKNNKIRASKNSDLNIVYYDFISKKRHISSQKLF